jgi:hypothetical protein
MFPGYSGGLKDSLCSFVWKQQELIHYKPHYSSQYRDQSLGRIERCGIHGGDASGGSEQTPHDSFRII